MRTFFCAGTCVKMQFSRGNSGEIGDGDNSGPGIAIHCGKSVELFQVDVFNAGFLPDPAGGRFIRGLVHSKEAAGNRPFSQIGMLVSPDQQKAEFSVRHCEDQYVHRHGGVLELRRIIFLQILLF